jgi:hypothetical protein
MQKKEIQSTFYIALDRFAQSTLSIQSKGGNESAGKPATGVSFKRLNTSFQKCSAIHNSIAE